MKKYKLKKDTFFYKAGTICNLTDKGNLVLDDNEGTCVLHSYQLKQHPELLDEWFEENKEGEYDGMVPEVGVYYYVIEDSGNIGNSYWDDRQIDKARFESGSAFWSYEKAKKELKRRKAYVILKKDTKGFKPNWKKFDERKWQVGYDHGTNLLYVCSSFETQSQNLHFAFRTDAESSIARHRQQWIDYLGIEGDCENA